MVPVIQPWQLRIPFGNKDSVSFWTHLFVGFFCKWKIIFFAGHKTFGFIGEIVVIVDGEVFYIKITYPYDLRVAEALIREER